MTWPSSAPAEWLFRTAVGGGFVLLLTWLVVRLIRQPARQQRLAEVGLVAALLVAVLGIFPAWLSLPVPSSWQPAHAEPQTDAATATEARHPDEDTTEPEPPLPGPVHAFAILPGVPRSESMPLPAKPTEPVDAAVPPAASLAPTWSSIPSRVPDWLLAGYLAVGSLLLARWLLAHASLWRLLATATPPPRPVAELFASLAPRPRARLLVSARLRVPVSCGLLRPTVVLPESFCADGSVLRWVFNHELAHLRRGDPWTCALFNLGQVVFWPLPWFWWLRRDVRLCQEYLADAAVLDEEGRPEEYSQFLLSLTSAPAVSAVVTGVSGYSSDLYRRITMMLGPKFTLERVAPRWWLTAAVAALLGAAVLVAGVGFTTAADNPKDQPKKEEPKKEQPKKEEPKKGEPLKANPLVPELDEIFRNFPPGAMEPKDLEDIQKELRKAFERLGRPFPGDGGFGPLNPPLVQAPSVRLGVRVEKPSETLVDQLDLPKGEGLVILDVEHDSAAEKAGLKAHDVLLAIDGKAVPSEAREFVKMLAGVKVNTPLEVVILRKGKKETLKGLSLTAAKEEARPALRNPVVPKFPLPGINPGDFGAGNVLMSVTRNGDHFTTDYREGNVSIKVEGTVKDGKAAAEEITIDDNGKSTSYTDVEKVPAEYRDKVHKALEAGAKARTKLDIRSR